MQISDRSPSDSTVSQSPRRRVLIVSPHFPPTNAPDHQRIRVALPYLSALGWEAEILAVQPHHVPHPVDPKLAEALPTDLPIVRTEALQRQHTSWIALGNVGWRCLPYFQQQGDRLLETKAFDLVFFSTTIFPVMTLGKRWHHRFGIPYVLDFQDPWRSDYHLSGNPKKQQDKPPGGWLKYGMTQFLARLCEPQAMQTVNHIISVSPTYPQILQQRYPWLQSDQFTVLPFGAPEHDFAQLPQLNIRQSIFDPNDGKKHWVYVGRGGADMATALRILFLGIQTSRQSCPELWQDVQLHFVGTSYAPDHLAVKTVEAIAQEYDVADLVTEHTRRIPYFEAQQLLVDSDAILMIGSDDPSYTASKLYPCILAKKPILAIFHEQSSVVNILNQCQAGQVVTFAQDIDPVTRCSEMAVCLNELLKLPRYYQPPTCWDAFRPYTAREMTRQLCEVFEQTVQRAAA
ncbi:MAG: hypothetical protein J0L70_30085 [Leptolyngbya sp. UWPOB_LEPTO1]|nr:hypothetical protein [Leptolyngbya sp. UWPOB_LEPTO1]